MIISIAAQKGGVGKTSLGFHLSGVFAEKNIKVLLCDLDPQNLLTSTFIDDVYSLNKTLKDLLSDPDLSASEIIQKTKFKNIYLLPSNLSLGSAEHELLSDPDSQYSLSDKLGGIKKDFDLILIDCPASLGVFTRMALVAADRVIIPIECSRYGVKSTEFLLQMISKVKTRANPPLQILGFVINKIDTRRRIEQEYRTMIREQLGGKVFKTEIRDSAKYGEAVALKIPINLYQPKSEQAEAFRELFTEIQSSGSSIRDSLQRDGENK
jgi:chromosome partitioning protein